MEAQRSQVKYSLENLEGVHVRTLAVPETDSDTLSVVRRYDTKRIELVTSTSPLESKKVRYDLLGTFKREGLANGQVQIEGVGRLVEIASGSTVPVIRNESVSLDSGRDWKRALAGVFVAMSVLMGGLLSIPQPEKFLEEEIKQQVVQIVKTVKVKPVPVQANVVDSRVSAVRENVTPTTKTASIKRMGALAVFGSMKSGSQKGGVNLGAVNTTAGPGLGGTAGSGGVQTSIYGKGLVAAPLGAGGNMQGGGGYGTKGKGGGQAGYGQISLVGSAGTAPIPLGREAIIGGGLDRDLIADVINRNLGQVRFCYEQGLQGDPALAGRVAVDFVIGGNGQVKAASVGSTTLNSKIVEDCILLRLKTWKFPLPEGGADVKVSYPFALRRTGQG